MTNHQKVLILDCGGRISQTIARLVRDNNVYCELYPFSKADEKIAQLHPKAVILTAEADFTADVPVMTAGENITSDSLREFLFDTCGFNGDWNMQSYIDDTIAQLRAQIGNGKVLCALSGGVDSSVCAALLSKAIGSALTCIFVDTGLMRKNEADEVQAAFADMFEMNYIRVEAQDRFLNKLKGVGDPEKKRKIIGEEFIRVFEDEAKKLGKIDFLCQGTIYPDIIESGSDDASVIKSHHNVGGLPSVVDFKELVEPVKLLFKDEVRALGAMLGLPQNLVTRQPFPGPGLGIRVLGEITIDKLDILREADAIFREEMMNAGMNKTVSQYFAVITNTLSVGMRDDKRTYENAIVLRGVLTRDFMTAEFARIPFDLLEKVSIRITTEIPRVNRVVYDITAKPPATIEWE